MKSFLINGIKVVIFKNGVTRIYTRDNSLMERVVKYLHDEGFYEAAGIAISK